tara:strand:- start:17 stop:550 length:534 start_codon:yes stop_codon:yes gene_type:complete
LGKVWEVIKNSVLGLWNNIKGFFYKDKNEVNIERIFKQFQKEIDNKKEGEILVIGTNIKENPILWLSMFKKIVLNHVNFIEQIKNFFQNEDVGMEIEEIDKAGEYIIFNRAWYYISNIDINNKEDRDIIKLTADDELLSAIKIVLRFFESIEDYEKCSFIKRIQDEVKLSLEKDVPS